MPESLLAKLAAARRRWRSLQTAGGLAASFTVLAALVLVSFYSDRLLVLGTGGRQGWQIGLLAGAAVAALVFLARPLLRPLPDEAIATEVERRFPTLGERLLTTIEMSRASAVAGVSGAMVAQLARDTERLAAPLPFERAVPTAPLRRPTAFAAVAAVLLLGHVILAPDAMGVWLRRILHPAADIPLYARTLVWALPGDRVALRGEDVDLGVKVGGRLADRATLHYRFGDGRWTSVALKEPQVVRAGNETFRKFPFTVSAAQQSITYYATAGDGRSNPHTVRIEDRPTILGVRLRFTYPAYTRRPARTVAATAGNIVAPPGTRVEIAATANKPLREALLVEDGKPRGRWAVDGETARGGLTVRRDQTYGLRLKDTSGFAALDPPQYTVRAQPDQTPVVQIVRPGADLERTPNGSVAFGVSATDDYGIQDVRLAYRVAARAGAVPLPGARGRAQVTMNGVWNLSSLSLKAGDTVTYEAVARDGDTVSGPHTGRSATYRVHILGEGEMRDRLEARVAEEQEALRRLIERQKAARADLPKADLARAQAEQRAAAQDAADLSRRMQQTNQQMRDNNLGAAAEQERREAAQQSLQQLAENAMPTAADTIQRAQQQAASRPGLTAEAARQQRQIQAEMERLAQQMGRAPGAAQLAQEAQALAAEQQRLAEQAELSRAQMGEKSPAQMSPAERAQLREQARQQAALRAQTEALQRQMRQAARDARERGQGNASEVQRAARQMEQANIAGQQNRAQRDLQAGQPSQAAARQNEAARDLRDLANQLAQAGQKPPDTAALRQRAGELESLADRLQKMARDQGSIYFQTRRSAYGSSDGASERPSDQALAEQERNLRAQSEQVRSQLQDVAAAQRALAQAGQSLQEAADQLSQSAPREALLPGIRAQRQLEQAAREARDAARALRQQYAAGDAQRAVEQLARAQRALQQQTRQADAARESLTPEQQQQRADALAQAQAKLLQRGQSLIGEMPSQGFQWAQNEANQRMAGAVNSLRQSETGADAQRQQERAAQTLERIARALGQQAQASAQQAGAQPQGGQPGGQPSPGDMETAAAAGELRLAREMEAQIRQDTAVLDRERRSSPDRRLTPPQQRDLEGLARAQRQTQEILRGAMEQLRGLPQTAEPLRQAEQEMEGVRDQLQEQQTGAPTQARQGDIVRLLDQAMSQVQQAMAQQQQQQMAQGQQPGRQPGQQPGQQIGGVPGAHRGRNPITGLQDGAFDQDRLRGRGFGELSPRAQKALREGREERVPAEYRELVNQYYKALSERGKR